jgi:putative ABC transport system permease protein
MLRHLRRHPAFAVTTILVLGLGIAAATAMFSVAYGVLLRDLPYADPDRLVSVVSADPRMQSVRPVAGAADFRDWRARQTVFADMALTRPVGSFNLIGSGEPERLAGARVTASLCSTLGVAPVVGRCFTELEERDPARASRVVLLGHALWQRRFGGDPAVVGRTIRVNGSSMEIVGVMGPAFRYPSREVEIWAPLYIPPQAVAMRRDYSYLAVGRLKPGVSLDAAGAQLASIAADLAREHPTTNRGTTARVRPLLAELTAPVRRTLLVLLGAVGVLFAITVFSIANLLLVQLAGRAQELAVRTTLGASRPRLARQVLGELLPIAAAAGALGLVGAHLLLRALVAMLPATLPRLDEIRLHPAVVAVGLALAVSAMAVMAIGAVWSIRTHLRRGPASWLRLRDALVTTQLAATVVLLVAGGLLVNTFARLRAVDPGLDATQVLSLHLAVDRARHGDDAGVAAYLARLEEAVHAVPGVASAGVINRLPLGGQIQFGGVQIDGTDATRDTSWRTASDGYFETLRVPVIAGRGFDRADRAGAPLVVVVDEALGAGVPGGARSLVGRRLRMDFPDAPWAEIVGVVGHVRDEGLDREGRPLIYWPVAQRTQDRMAMVVRTGGDPAAAATAVRAAIRSVDPDQALYDVRPMTAVIERSLDGYRLNAVLTGAFAGFALLLGATGLFGVMSALTERRRREFGLRLALGASRWELARIVLRQGLVRAAGGAACGLIAAALLTGLMRGLLVGVAPFDLPTYSAVAVGLIGVAVAAALVPAWRAARVDPLGALRD